jgi:hypothetical protein
VLGSVLGIFWAQRHRTRQVVHAALYSSGTFDAAKALQDTSGGMAQYGYAIQQATDFTTDFQAVSNWNTYIASRSSWSMSSTISSRLANADWNARQAGSPTITAQQLANAINHLINSVLGTMTASQQLSLLRQNMGVPTPKGLWSLVPDNPNYGGASYVSATQNPGGTWTVTISPDLFSRRKAFFQKYAPGMVSSPSNLYPAEAMLVTYSLVTDDKGYNDSTISSLKAWIGDATGVDMTNQQLYGPSGYFARRPLGLFFTDATLGQFFADLGF